LDVEEQFWADRLQVLEKAVASDEDIKRHQKNLAELPAKAATLEQQIRTEETLLVEQRTLRQDLSPRSVEQGWLEQVERNIANTRESITKAKLELVFGVRRAIREAEVELQKRTDEVNDAREKRNRFAKWKDEELEELWDCQRQHDKVELLKSKRQSIADERRRWAVTWTVPSGKPEKDEGALAEQRKRRVEQSVGAFCGGTVDLLAANKPRTGDQDQPQNACQLLQSLVERVKLRSHQNEALAFDALLDPILRKMRDGSAPSFHKNKGEVQAGPDERAMDKAERDMDNKTNANATKTIGREPNAPKNSTVLPQLLPRSMPFADLSRVRAEREAFERRVDGIRNDANCRRWMNEGADGPS